MFLESVSDDSINAGALWESIGGDFEYFEELIVMFMAARPALIAKIRQKLADHDFLGAARTAKILTNVLRSLQAHDACDRARVLEMEIQGSGSEAALRSLAPLECAIGRAEVEFSQILVAIEDQTYQCLPATTAAAFVA